MSRANRTTFVYLVSLLTVCDCLLARSEFQEGELIWVRRIREHVTHGGPSDLVRMEIKPKGLERLKDQSKQIVSDLLKDYSLMVILNIWLVWVEDVLALVRDPAKREFFEELHADIDGFYAMFDANYKCMDEALEAIQASKRMMREIT